MNVKKLFLTISLVILLACGVYAAIVMASGDPTYDGSETDVVALYENPERGILRRLQLPRLRHHGRELYSHRRHCRLPGRAPQDWGKGRTEAR